MAAFPLTISLIVFFGRPVRSANSACDIPLDSRISCNVSPGGETTSGAYWVRTISFMSICDLNDANTLYFAPRQAAVRLAGNWISDRPKDQAIRSIEIHRQLTLTVARQFVAAPWEQAHRFQIRRGVQVVEPPSNELRALAVEPLGQRFSPLQSRRNLSSPKNTSTRGGS